MASANSTPARILLVEDSDIDADLVTGHLRKSGLWNTITRVRDYAAFEQALTSGEIDIVVHDYTLATADGFKALALIRSVRPDTPLIFLSGIPGEEHASGALKSGAADYVLKRNLSRLAASVERALAETARGRERAQAAAELGRKDRDFQNALKAGRFGTWTLDLESKTLNASALCKINFGRHPNERFTYDDMLAAIHPEDRERWAGAMDRAFVSGADLDLEYRIMTPAGQLRWLAVRGQFDDAVGERPATLSGVTGEITERVNLENELRLMNDTLERRVQERTQELLLTQDALRQSQKMEAVGQLTGGIAHDFNNLLASIIGGLDLLDRRIAKGDVEGALKYSAAARDSARRAATLTQRLLAFSRRQTLAPKPLDPVALVEGLEDLIRRTIGPEIALEISAGQKVWLTKVDAPQLENAVLNLCINARDAMAGRPGRLVIQAENVTVAAPQLRVVQALPPGDYVRLSVTDAGTGMTPDVLARAFDPFFTTKPLGSGTGLGLSMVYGFVQQSGGEVRIDSQVGVGTAVHMYLPRFTGESLSQQAEPTKATMSGGQGETVLVVDDEHALRMVMCDTLRESGFRPLEAEDGPSALKILNSNVPIDLLVTDVGLPGGLNGRQLAEIAREYYPDLKILFVTGFADKSVLGSEAFDQRMELLRKPFPVAGLAAKVKSMLTSLS